MYNFLLFISKYKIISYYTLFLLPIPLITCEQMNFNISFLKSSTHGGRMRKSNIGYFFSILTNSNINMRKLWKLHKYEATMNPFKNKNWDNKKRGKKKNKLMN